MIILPCEMPRPFELISLNKASVLSSQGAPGFVNTGWGGGGPTLGGEGVNEGAGGGGGFEGGGGGGTEERGGGVGDFLFGFGERAGLAICFGSSRDPYLYFKNCRVL